MSHHLASKLTAQDIYHQDFPISPQGYDIYTIDSFLDIVIQDYRYFTRELHNLQDLLAVYERENTRLKTQSSPSSDNHPYNSNQLEILKRLSRIEQLLTELTSQK